MVTLIHHRGSGIPIAWPVVLGLLICLCVSGVAYARVDNPFIGADGYVDSDFVRHVRSSMATADESLRVQMDKVARQPTAVWLDSLEALDGYNGRRSTLEQHLVSAVKQAAGGRPRTILVVLYNLPDRDCGAQASNGLLRGESGLERYRTDYIDRIARTFSDPRFAGLRIVALIEPDSLPNLVTNQASAGCMAALRNGTYVEGIAYALRRFAAIDNVYSYLDIGHSGWLGWDNNRARAVQLYTEVVLKAGSLDYLQGVVSNVSGYTPVEELLLPDPDYSIEGRPVKSARFYEYNSVLDERGYADALKQEFMAAGFSSRFGILIDTSRNGWGGPSRPVSAAWKADVNTFVDAARLDRRAARGNWCNQKDAGIGERPQGDPFNDGVIHAFVWVKPPGESDGTSDVSQTTPDEQGKSFDPFCNPEGMTPVGHLTGALGDAPAAGEWFPEHFQTLVRNAYPKF